MNNDPLMRVNDRPSQTMVRGEGSWLYDDEGTRYLDFVQGWAVNALGHCPVEVQTALAAQSRVLLTASPAYHNAPARELSLRLVESSGLGKAFLCNSGAEANECAVKLARKWGRLNKAGASQIITTTNGFHGRTLAMMSASGKPGWDILFPPSIPGFRKVSYADPKAILGAIDEETCAVMVEPIQGEAGVVVPPPGYLSELRRMTRDTNTLLIFDEIQTGVGRTGSLYRFQAEDAKPDILTLGKGLGGGVPLAAVVTSDDAACFAPGEHGGTYCGNPLMASVGAAVFDTVSQPDFLKRVRHAGERLRRGLSKLQSGANELAEVRGAGLLQAAVLTRPLASRVADQAKSLGLLLNAPRPDVLRFMPSLRVSDEEIDLAIERLDAAFSAALAFQGELR